jgi:tetratricopeptide (TPR) repeat protein
MDCPTRRGSSGRKPLSTRVAGLSTKPANKIAREYEEAEGLYLDALEVARAQGATYPAASIIVQALAGMYRLMDAHDQAVEILVEHVELLQEEVEEEHPLLVEARHYLGGALCGAGEHERAAAIFTDLKRFLAEDSGTLLLEMTLRQCACLRDLQRYEEAESVALSEYDQAVHGEAPDVLARDKLAQFLHQLYSAWGQSEESRLWRERIGRP